MDKDVKNMLKFGGGIVAALAVLGGLYSASEKIDAGERGVIRTWGKVNEDQVLTEGLNFRIPIVQDVIKYSIRDQKLELRTEAFTKDIQNVVMDLVINYRIDASSVAKVYKQFGDLARVEDILIKPVVLGELKNNFGKWEAVELIENRAKSAADLHETLCKKLAENYVQILDIQYKNVDFSDKFENAVEEKVTAAQNVLTERNKSEQQKEKSRQEVIRAEAEAAKIELMAKAKANAIRIESEAEAEALKLKATALDYKNLILKAIEQWNGELPKVMPAGNNPFILDVKNFMQENNKAPKGTQKPTPVSVSKQQSVNLRLSAKEYQNS